MPIEVSKATAPAHWAVYLINGDASSFDYSNTPDDKAGDRDQAECDAWTDKLALDGWRVVSCDGESYFKHSNDAGTLPGDVLEYTLLRDFEIPALDSDCALRNVRVDDHRLFVWDTYKRDFMGKSLLGYALYAPSDNASPIFYGRDYGCSPLSCVDSDDALRGLLGFLTLRPGDTDADYFAEYTPRQIEWCGEFAEALAVYASEPQQDDAETYAFADID